MRFAFDAAGNRLFYGRKCAAQANSPDVDINATAIDKPLIFGSLLFGIGWGLSGYCPSPALVAASSGNSLALWYVISMAIGMVIGKLTANHAPQLNEQAGH